MDITGYATHWFQLVAASSFRDLLAEKGITEYELADEVDEGRLLPAYKNLGEIEDCSGTVGHTSSRLRLLA